MQLQDRVEKLIIHGLLNDDVYARKVLSILQPEYFTDSIEQNVFSQIKEFFLKYNSIPTKEAIIIQAQDVKGMQGDLYNSICSFVSELVYEKPPHPDFLLDQTDKFAKNQAFYNALKKGIQIMDDKSGKLDKGMAVKYMQDALSVCLDPDVGHSYTEDIDARYDAMHQKVDKVPFDLQYFNKITSGGVEKKTLNIVMGGTGAGKSLCLCHFAAAALMDGKNVAYITLEMSQEKIAERIDANLLNVSLGDLRKLTEDQYKKKVHDVKNKTAGRLFVKGWPTAAGNVFHFQAWLMELSLKEKFAPDIIFVDYLNIASSSRIKLGSQVNSYTYVKSIAEELRGLAVEYNVPLFSATQTNRQGFTSSDPGLENSSESFGVPATADFMVALTRTEELDKLGQMVVTQLKNRYGDVTYYRRFVIGVDRAKMKLFDVEDAAQHGLSDSGQADKDDTPAFSQTKFGKAMSGEKKDFSTLNFDDDDDMF